MRLLGSVTRSPSSRTSPPVGWVSPLMQLSSVVFPAPDGPTTETNSPGATAKLSPCRVGAGALGYW